MTNDEPQPRRKSHRLPADAYTRSDCSYFFTLCARDREAPFLSGDLAQAVVGSLLWTRDRYRWEVYAYCLMPDHFHFLCRPVVPASFVMNGGARGTILEGVLEQVARLKSYTTTIAWSHGINGQLWQRSSYDVILDHQTPTEQIARYVLDNPVRKGFVTQWTDWSYSGIPDPW